MYRLTAILGGALLWAQTSPSWGRAQIDSARSIIPRYVVSAVAQTNTRLPYFALLRITGLEPNTTYRYVSRMDSTKTPPSSNNINFGAGNPIFYNPSSQTFSLTTNPSLSTAGGYGTITTDADGEAWLIFGLQPTGNIRFRTDGGNQVYVKVFFRSDAAPVDSAYVIGDKTPIQPLALRTITNNADTTGSFLYDSALTVPNTLVFLYDSYGPHSLGERPLTGAVVEGTGISWGNNQLPAYISEVAGRNGRYGTLIPNSCTGVKAIHYVDPQAPGLSCERAIYDQDGVWPSGISTVAPTNGPAALGLLNSPYYPLLPDPGNTCISVSSSDINPFTGSIHIGYTVQPTEGFLYGFWLYTGMMNSCLPSVGPNNIPFNIPQADSTNPMMPYIYGLCDRNQWGTTIDSIDGSMWPLAPLCDPCAWYIPVNGVFFWRCMRGEGGFLVRNFTYYGDEAAPPPTFFSTANVTLEARRVPKKVTWITPPPPAANPGEAFMVMVQLEDSLTPARWGGGGMPDFSGCSFPPATLRILDANGSVVNTHSGTWTTGLGMPTAQFNGTFPNAPGQYRLVVEGVGFPSCGCSGYSGSGWNASDTLLVTISSTSALNVYTQPAAWVVEVPTQDGRLLLLNAQGQVVWEASSLTTNSIPRQGLPEGIYTIVWQGKERVRTHKVAHISP